MNMMLQHGFFVSSLKASDQPSYHLHFRESCKNAFNPGNNYNKKGGIFEMINIQLICTNQMLEGLSFYPLSTEIQAMGSCCY